MIQVNGGVKRASAVIPAHNEEEHITKVVERAKKIPSSDVIDLAPTGSALKKEVLQSAKKKERERPLRK